MFSLLSSFYNNLDRKIDFNETESEKYMINQAFHVLLYTCAPMGIINYKFSNEYF